MNINLTHALAYVVPTALKLKHIGGGCLSFKTDVVNIHAPVFCYM